MIAPDFFSSERNCLFAKHAPQDKISFDIKVGYIDVKKNLRLKLEKKLKIDEMFVVYTKKNKIRHYFQIPVFRRMHQKTA